MADKILVTYVSSTGTTAGVAGSAMFGVWKEGDHRDWKAISDWAKSLVLCFI